MRVCYGTCTDHKLLMAIQAAPVAAGTKGSKGKHAQAIPFQTLLNAMTQQPALVVAAAADLHTQLLATV